MQSGRLFVRVDAGFLLAPLMNSATNLEYEPSYLIILTHQRKRRPIHSQPDGYLASKELPRW